MFASFDFSKGESPIIDSWFLMGSPTSLLIIFGIYLLAVYYALPNYMKRRQAYKLTTITRCYNIFQVLCCIYLIKSYYENGWSYTNSFDCNYKPPSKALMGIAGVWWINTQVRVIELVETIFFLLRKKNNQASPLHVYHHLSSIVTAWSLLKYEPQTFWLVFAVTNSGVHTIMYFYYFLSSFKGLTKLTNVVKPLITIIQIIQLLFFIGHCMFIQFGNCKSNFAIIQILNVSILVYFFVKFYVQSYSNKKPTKTD